MSSTTKPTTPQVQEPIVPALAPGAYERLQEANGRLANRLQDSPAPPTPEQKFDMLEQYRLGISSWNEKVNLTAIIDPDEFVEKHYLDSLSVVDLPEFVQAKTVLDLGTGGGFPGVPLAVYDTTKEYTLVDSLQKRLAIIDELTEKIGLSNVTTCHGRAEELGKDPAHREQCDLCVCRAVAALPVLLELALPLVKVGGSLIAYKGPEADEEIAQSQVALEKLGGQVDRVVQAPGTNCADDKEESCGSEGKPSGNLLGEDQSGHVLVVVHKISPTPDAYPRRPGMPNKRPLR